MAGSDLIEFRRRKMKPLNFSCCDFMLGLLGIKKFYTVEGGMVN